MTENAAELARALALFAADLARLERADGSLDDGSDEAERLQRLLDIADAWALRENEAHALTLARAHHNRTD